MLDFESHKEQLYDLITVKVVEKLTADNYKYGQFDSAAISVKPISKISHSNEYVICNFQVFEDDEILLWDDRIMTITFMMNLNTQEIFYKYFYTVSHQFSV